MNQAYNNPSSSALQGLSVAGDPASISLPESSLSGPSALNPPSGGWSTATSPGNPVSDFLQTIHHHHHHNTVDDLGVSFSDASATPSLGSPFTNPGTPSVFTSGLQRASSVIAHAPSSNSSSDSLAPSSPQKPRYHGHELWGHQDSCIYSDSPTGSDLNGKQLDNSATIEHSRSSSFGALPCLNPDPGVTSYPGASSAGNSLSMVKNEPGFFVSGTPAFSPGFVHPNYSGSLFPSSPRFPCVSGQDNSTSGSIQDNSFVHPTHPHFSELLSPLGFHPHQQFLSPAMPSHNQHQFINHLATFNGKNTMGKSRGGRRPKEDERGVSAHFLPEARIQTSYSPAHLSVQSIDPQDAEKRRLRRIRNKEAAARCRQRRIDLMNTLQDQVTGLEDELEKKKDEIEQLKQEKGNLEYLLRNHQCKIDGLNGFPATTSSAPVQKPKKFELGSLTFRAPKIDPDQTLTQVVTESINMDGAKIDVSLPHTSIAPTSLGISILDRPITLNLGSGLTPTTPSNGLFGELMGLPTGLTPVNSTGYTPLMGSAGLSLETPTTSMDTESGIINVKTSLCQL